MQITSKLSLEEVRKYVTGAYLGEKYTMEELQDGIHLLVERVDGKTFISRQRKLF